MPLKLRPRRAARAVARWSSRLLRPTFKRLPAPLQLALFRGGQRSDRLRDPDAVIAALGMRPGDRVADLGPGYGHFTLRLARAVAPDGICYAADADAETLEDLSRAAAEREITNLRPVLTSARQLELPEPVDLLFVSATYHHLRRPVRYFKEARSLLRPGGRVAILESRLEGVAARWMNPHGSVPQRVHLEMSRAGYELVETHDFVHGHWFAVFTISPRDNCTGWSSKVALDARSQLRAPLARRDGARHRRSASLGSRGLSEPADGIAHAHRAACRLNRQATAPGSPQAPLPPAASGQPTGLAGLRLNEVLFAPAAGESRLRRGRKHQRRTGRGRGTRLRLTDREFSLDKAPTLPAGGLLLVLLDGLDSVEGNVIHGTGGLEPATGPRQLLSYSPWTAPSWTASPGETAIRRPSRAAPAGSSLTASRDRGRRSLALRARTRPERRSNGSSARPPHRETRTLRRASASCCRSRAPSSTQGQRTSSGIRFRARPPIASRLRPKQVRLTGDGRHGDRAPGERCEPCPRRLLLARPGRGR